MSTNSSKDLPHLEDGRVAEGQLLEASLWHPAYLATRSL